MMCAMCHCSVDMAVLGTSSLPVRETTEMAGDAYLLLVRGSLFVSPVIHPTTPGKWKEAVEMVWSILPKIDAAGNLGVGVVLDTDDVSQAKCLLLQAFLHKTHFQSSYMNLSLGKLSQSIKWTIKLSIWELQNFPPDVLCPFWRLKWFEFSPAIWTPFSESWWG